MLDYCRRLGVALEPFTQDNTNAHLDASGAFDGKPVRAHEIAADYRGHVAELLAKVVDQDALERTVGAEDKAILLESLRGFGALSADLSYVQRDDASERRGWEGWPDGGTEGRPLPSTPLDPDEVLRARLWQYMAASAPLAHQLPMFQPRGGMDRIARAFEREVRDLIRYGARVKALRQEEDTVTATFEDRASGVVETATADWCLCTIPRSIRGQLDRDLSPALALANAIDSVKSTTALKIGLEFARRFWEEDDGIYGGITYTDLPISLIGYPSNDVFEAGPRRPARCLRLRTAGVPFQRTVAGRADRALSTTARASIRDTATASRAVSPSSGPRCRGRSAALEA